MPIDRGDTLRNAEKLVRQGKLDQAIAEYVRVVADQPRDWNTGNTLGDLTLQQTAIGGCPHPSEAGSKKQAEAFDKGLAL